MDTAERTAGMKTVLVAELKVKLARDQIALTEKHIESFSMEHARQLS